MNKINAKAKGIRRERECKKQLESEGYLVTKAGGSLGSFDVIALGYNHVLCIQIKSNRLPPKKEMETLRQLRLKLNRDIFYIEIWVYKDYKGVKKYDVYGKDTNEIR